MTPLLQVAALPGYGNGYAARARIDASCSAMPEAAQGHADPGCYLGTTPTPLDVFAARLSDIEQEFTRKCADWPKTPPQPACWPEFIPQPKKEPQ